MSLEIIRPGVVVLRNILNLEEQCCFLDIVKNHGGLKNEDDMWNFFERRGRTFDAVTNYPPEDAKFVRNIFERMRRLVETDGTQIPPAGFTHMLTWWYPDQKGMGWHIDGYGGNDGDADAPVYSLTLGNSCIFEWKPVDHPETIETVQINSGDVIVFGGPERLMKHRVKKILLNSFIHPNLEDFNARINITFRKLDNFTEENEREYQTDLYKEKYLESKKNKI